ncbi:UNVERIFIED_ORG: DNA-binding transcriptional LysR family regulator [Bradyrhizobium japonicum]|nr:LysR family transcriptional regulator [Bradyrhizobium diazoefficiens]WLA55931.1 LysR family transcriptional regulator [Bradyrhizobium diazoefficiens]
MAKAAERLAISRPVISRTIANLEHVLGVTLLDRTARGVEPTMFGEALLKRGTAVFDELRQSVEEIAFLADPQAGELRIACTEVWAAGLVPAAIERLSKRLPRLRVRLEQGTASHQFNLLRQRQCEIVISRLLTETPDSDIEMQPLFYESLVVVAGPQSSWSRRRKLTLSELVDVPWILSTLEAESGSPFVEAFRAAKLSIPTATIFSNSLHLRISLLATGRYLTLVPGSALQFGPGADLLKALPVALPRWHLPTAIFTLKGRMLSPVAQVFANCIRDVAKPLA